MVATLLGSGYFSFGLYSLILILVGTPLNLLCFYIFKRHIPNRSNATIIVFSYLALIELLIPFTWNLNYAVRELIWKRQKSMTIKNLEQHSLFACKLLSFGAYFLLQSAAWLKTLATFARCVTLHHEWTIKKYLSKSHIVHRLCWITILFIGLINFPIWFINGQRVISIDTHNNTQIQIRCYQSKFFQSWEIVHLLLYNFLPFTLMILLNISIIRYVRASRRRTERAKQRSHSLKKHSSTSFSLIRFSGSNNDGRLTKTLIFITIFFIIFTSPSAIFYIFLGKKVKRHRHLITMGLSNLATTSHIASFIIYWLTSTDFQNAVSSFIYCRPVAPQRLLIEDKQQEKLNSTLPASVSLLTIPSCDSQRKLSRLQSSQSFHL